MNNETAKCSHCNGSGYITIFGREETDEDCPYCSGHGIAQVDKCYKCIIRGACLGYYEGCFEAVNGRSGLDYNEGMGENMKHKQEALINKARDGMKKLLNLMPSSGGNIQKILAIDSAYEGGMDALDTLAKELGINE